jgi:CMP/dCMP kinase
MRKHIITIDGSAWTGKSTVSTALAKLLGYQVLNTGLMFRSLSYLIRKAGMYPENVQGVLQILEETTMEYKLVDDVSTLFVNGSNFNYLASDNSVVENASKIAAIPEVRTKLAEMQRKICQDGGFIIEGRDTGTAVFPNAEWKFFLDADVEVKIDRFFKLLSYDERGNYTREQVRGIIEETDTRDREREVAPLTRAADAILYNNSNSPNAERDAIVLWHYIHNHKDIIENATILRKKQGNNETSLQEPSTQ